MSGQLKEPVEGQRTQAEAAAQVEPATLQEATRVAERLGWKAAALVQAADHLAAAWDPDYSLKATQALEPLRAELPAAARAKPRCLRRRQRKGLIRSDGERVFV